MKRKQVQSSNIRSIGYNGSLGILEVEFNGSSVYYYKEVKPEVVVELLLAESIGAHFASNIKTKYPYVKGEYNV